MKKPELKYGSYINELCCDDCNYAGEYNTGGWCPLEPVQVCPDCGGKLSRQIGRWLYTETKSHWWNELFVGYGTKTVYHNFVKGRECESLSTPKPPPTEYV